MSLLVVVTLGFVGIEGLECYWDIRVVGDEEVVRVVDVDLIAKAELIKPASTASGAWGTFWMAGEHFGQ